MSFRRSLIWSYLGQFVAFIGTFGGSVVVARLLSPHELGIFGIAMALSGVLSVFTSFGVGSYVVRDGALDSRTLDTAFTVNALLCLLLSCLLLAASFAGQRLFDDPGVGQVLELSAISPLLSIVGFRASVMFQREMLYGTIAAIGVLNNLSSMAVTVAAAWLGYSYLSPAYGTLTGAIIANAAYGWKGRAQWSLRCSLAEWKSIATFGVRLIFIGGVSQMTGRLCEIVLAKAQSLTALGLYGRASGLSNMIWTNLYGSATQVIFSQLSKDLRETGEVRTTFVRSMRNMLALVWPMLIGLAVLSKPVIAIIYGERWLAAAAPLSLLMLMQAFSLVYGMNWELFVLRDRMREQTRMEVLRSVIGFSTFALGAQFSLVGAAIGRALDAFIGLWLYVPFMRSLAGTARGELRRIYAESALLTAGAVGPSIVLIATSPMPERCSPLSIAGTIILGGVLWLMTLVWLNHPLLEEIKPIGGRSTSRLRPAA